MNSLDPNKCQQEFQPGFGKETLNVLVIYGRTGNVNSIIPKLSKYETAKKNGDMNKNGHNLLGIA